LWFWLCGFSGCRQFVKRLDRPHRSGILADLNLLLIKEPHRLNREVFDE